MRISNSWHDGHKATKLSVTLSIAKDGQRLDTSISKSSGDKNVDEEALAAIRATKFPPLPDWYLGKRLVFDVELSDVRESSESPGAAIHFEKRSQSSTADKNDEDDFQARLRQKREQMPDLGPAPITEQQSKYRDWSTYEHEQRRRLAKSLHLPKSFRLEAILELIIYPVGSATSKVKLSKYICDWFAAESSAV